MMPFHLSFLFFSGFAAAVAYAFSPFVAKFFGDLAGKGLLLLAWVLHGIFLMINVFDAAPHFGFAPALSVTAWLALVVYALELHLYPRIKTLWGICGICAFAVLSSLFFKGQALPETSSPLLPLHLSLGISAYGLFAAAVIHGFLMNRAETQMRHLTSSAMLDSPGIPLLTLERLMFRFVFAGFVLLSLTIIAGAFFGQHLYGASYSGWKFDHKRIFTVLSWIVFAWLLLGRWRFGIRGRFAVRLLYLGSLFLLLGYVGSRFVLEVVLGRGL